MRDCTKQNIAPCCVGCLHALIRLRMFSHRENSARRNASRTPLPNGEGLIAAGVSPRMTVCTQLPLFRRGDHWSPAFASVRTGDQGSPLRFVQSFRFVQSSRRRIPRSTQKAARRIGARLFSPLGAVKFEILVQKARDHAVVELAHLVGAPAVQAFKPLAGGQHIDLPGLE